LKAPLLNQLVLTLWEREEDRPRGAHAHTIYQHRQPPDSSECALDLAKYELTTFGQEWRRWASVPDIE
jgi:hypothetical protein